MNRSPLLLGSSLLFVSLFACGPAAEPPPGKVMPTQRALASAGALTVELLSFSPLAVGQNRVFYKVTHDGQPAAEAELTQRPLMQMATQKHACPLQNPAHAPNADGLFEGLLVFNMASTETEKWTLTLDVALEHGAPVTVDLGALEVADSTMKKVVTRDGKKLVLTLGYPEQPVVGANPVVVTAHAARDMTMMEFDPVEDLVFSLETEMPSMGHGAAGNVSPVLSEDKLYRGTAAFSMPGDWVVHLGVSANDAALGTFDFALDL